MEINAYSPTANLRSTGSSKPGSLFLTELTRVLTSYATMSSAGYCVSAARRLLDCAVQPRVAIFAPQYRRHAMGVVARIVDVGHERIRGHRDVHARFNHCPVVLRASIPKPGKGKKVLVGECDQVR